ncbi:MAG: VanZ family protein [Planctomycetota bacterium]|nr:MAG: VanZ family protein [Planctomycetota bacterium]
MTEAQETNWSKRLSVAVLGVYWLVLATATHVPQIEPPLGVQPSDKVEHVAAFGLLAVLLALAWSHFTAMTWRSYAAILAVIAVYGAVDEITQPLTRRNADVMDWLADVTGAIAGLAVFAIARRLRAR